MSDPSASAAASSRVTTRKPSIAACRAQIGSISVTSTLRMRAEDAPIFLIVSISRRRSRIETELPPNIRAEVNRILLEGATYEEAAQYCHRKGHDISRSSMGRYGKVFFETYARVKRFEDQAAALTSEPLSKTVSRSASLRPW